MKKIFIAMLTLLCLSDVFLFGETIKVVVTSSNAQKNAAVRGAFEKRFPPYTVEVISCKSDSGVPSQPIGYEVALKGARNRIDNLPQELLLHSQYVVSIENFIEYLGDSWSDVGLVVVKDLAKEKDETIVSTRNVFIPSQYVELAREISTSITEEGFSTTIGKSIQKSFSQQVIDSQDWQKEESFGGVSRKTLLEEALFKALYKEEIVFLKDHIKIYKDFPKPGIAFEDFFPILSHGDAFHKCIDLLYEWYKDKDIEMVIGIESRGFILGAALAYKLGIGFAPVRKPGKLPGLTYFVNYQKEYGVDTLVVSQSALQPKQKTLIVDDLIATGGSARAAIELVKLAGGDPVEFVSLLEVKGLSGRASLGVPSFNLID